MLTSGDTHDMSELTNVSPEMQRLYALRERYANLSDRDLLCLIAGTLEEGAAALQAFQSGGMGSMMSALMGKMRG